MIRKPLKEAINLSSIPAYRIAQRSGMNPSTLSKIVCGISNVKNGDSRIIKVGKILGIKAEDCFQNNDEDGTDQNHQNPQGTHPRVLRDKE